MDKNNSKIIMPVYNGEKYLVQSIESILNQTYRNFEFIIINDGSDDKSLNIVNRYKETDERIIVVSRDNKGLIYSLNEGIDLAKGEYIARMDCDDISMPDRLEKQIRFLQSNIEYGLIGTWYIQIDKDNNEIQEYYFPKRNEEIKAFFAVANVLAHGSIMARKELLSKNKYGAGNYNLIEDFDLWVRIAAETKIAILGEFLYKYRWYSDNFSNQKFSAMRNEMSELTQDYWENNFSSIKYYLNFIFDSKYNKTRCDGEKKFIFNYSYGFVKRAIFSRKYIFAISIYLRILKCDKFKLKKLLRLIQVFFISLLPTKLADRYNLRKLF